MKSEPVGDVVLVASSMTPARLSRLSAGTLIGTLADSVTGPCQVKSAGRMLSEPGAGRLLSLRMVKGARGTPRGVLPGASLRGAMVTVAPSEPVALSRG